MSSGLLMVMMVLPLVAVLSDVTLLRRISAESSCTKRLPCQLYG